MNEQSTNASTDPSVLIVEDNEGCREALAEHFRLAEGFGNVIEAQCGAEALELFERHSPEVIVCDCRLPWMMDPIRYGKYGFEVVEHIRTKKGARPVVIMVSAFTDISGGAAYASGADAAFSKTIFGFGNSVVSAARHHLKTRRELLRGTEHFEARAGTRSPQ